MMVRYPLQFQYLTSFTDIYFLFFSLSTLFFAVNESNLNATNILTHVFNSICMFVDLLIVAHPLRLLHMFLPVVFGIIYAIFSAIYQLSGGHNM